MSRHSVWRYARRLRIESLESRRVLATFTVTNLNDAIVVAPGNAPGTLRQAIYDANHTAGADTIAFAANLSGVVNLSFADDTAFGASALVVTSPITIVGNANGVTIARSTEALEMRLFRVTAAGDLTLQSLSLTAGLARGANAAAPDQEGGYGMGGAIYNGGKLQIVSSTLYGNRAIGGNGGLQSGISGTGRGGAIYNDNTLVITNSTLSGNSSESGLGFLIVNSFGGATYSLNGSTSIRNSTISSNSAPSGRGVYVLVDGNGVATLDIQSSIVGQSDTEATKRDLVIATMIVDAPITVTGSNNLIRSQSTYNYLTISTDDPMIGPLSSNGGPTMTHALQPESPAVNAGNNSQSLDRDQRGNVFSRVVGGAADIGAFELQSVVTPPLPTDYNGNSVVDAADYVVWRKTLGQSLAAYAGGDGTGEGTVDESDLNAWRATFGNTAPGAASIVFSKPKEDAGKFSRNRSAGIATPSIQRNDLLLAINGEGREAVENSEDSVVAQTSLEDSNSVATDAVDAVFTHWPGV